MEIFPESLQKLWNKWELRAMVLLSLFLQIILIGFGNRRKYISKNWIRLILWLAYLCADWVATVALGVLSTNLGDSKDESADPTYVIMAFWAPFLLLHLGGPDTITAYSMEDNELWLRHLLSLIVQVGVAFYVFIKSLRPTNLNFVATPMFVAGMVKYGERTWALRSASSQHFRESLLPKPDPGPNYAKFMEEYILKAFEGFELSWTTNQSTNIAAYTYTSQGNDLVPESAILTAAYEFLKTYRKLFADLILSFQHLEKSQSFFQRCSWEDAFKVIEVELGFMFDMLYTKATLVCSIAGALLRSISLSSTIVASVAFSMIDKEGYSKIDISISYFLLVGAIGLEIYAILIMFSSDWTMLWLSKQETLEVNLIYKVLSALKFVASKKRWSDCMMSYNLINSCFKNEPANCFGVSISSCIDKIIENHGHETSENIPSTLKKFIFNHLVEKSKGASDFKLLRELCSNRGEQVLQMYNCVDKLSWTIEVEYDHSILLWHVATDLCYRIEDRNAVADSKRELSKLLSDYLLYILVKRPSMLPNGIGQIRFQDTHAEAMDFIRERKSISDGNLACERLLQVDTRIPPGDVKGDRSKSVLFDACRLAKSLQSLEIEEKWESQQKWEMISLIWVEMLSYAASQCRWNQHAQQLRRGGELLTHVWLLMAHLGLTEQFQISQGHARTRLLVE